MELEFLVEFHISIPIPPLGKFKLACQFGNQPNECETSVYTLGSLIVKEAILYIYTYIYIRKSLC